MHTPRVETFYGVLHANAALFEAPFDTDAAQKEHQNYIATLQKNGIKVIQVTDVLLKGTLNDDGSRRKGVELDKLIEFASEFLTYHIPTGWSEKTLAEQKEYKIETLRNLHPKDLVRIILERPEIYLKYSTEHNTKFIADLYQSRPLMNMHFLRDQQITTAKGVVLGKMNSTQRENEVNITEFVFHKLGINPIYRVTGDGRLEGGDYIPAGDFALIAQGLRTNAEGIRQLLENDVFGFSEIAVVKDPFMHQDQMHLDTYFNILGPKKAIVDKIRREKGLITRGDVTRPIRPCVDIYKKKADGTYECVQTGKDFFDYIEKEKGFEVIDIQDSEQLNYGCNFLCIGPNKIIGVKGVSERYLGMLQSAGVDATLLEFRNVTKGYGAPHCTTQVICRTGAN
jgi:arginine deiminase